MRPSGPQPAHSIPSTRYYYWCMFMLLLCILFEYIKRSFGPRRYLGPTTNKTVLSQVNIYTFRRIAHGYNRMSDRARGRCAEVACACQILEFLVGVCAPRSNAYNSINAATWSENIILRCEHDFYPAKIGGGKSTNAYTLHAKEWCTRANVDACLYLGCFLYSPSSAVREYNIVNEC